VETEETKKESERVGAISAKLKEASDKHYCKYGDAFKCLSCP
jgi:hypothetical protein